MGHKGKLVNKTELAEIVGVHERTISRWQKNGLPILADGTRGYDNRYDTVEVIDWMVQREIENRITDHGGSAQDFYDYEAERARLTHHQANMAAMDEKTKAGKLIPADVVANAWGGLVSAFRARTLGIPTKVAPKLIGLTSLAQIQALLKEEVYQALSELSNYDPEVNDSSSADRISEDGGTAT